MTSTSHHTTSRGARRTTDREVTMNVTYTHTLSGRTFVATGDGAFGAASVDGTWDSGQVGTIWPTETLAGGAPVWVAA